MALVNLPYLTAAPVCRGGGKTQAGRRPGPGLGARLRQPGSGSRHVGPIGGSPGGVPKGCGSEPQTCGAIRLAAAQPGVSAAAAAATERGGECVAGVLAVRSQVCAAASRMAPQV